MSVCSHEKIAESLLDCCGNINSRAEIYIQISCCVMMITKGCALLLFATSEASFYRGYGRNDRTESATSQNPQRHNIAKPAKCGYPTGMYTGFQSFQDVTDVRDHEDIMEAHMGRGFRQHLPQQTSNRYAQQQTSKRSPDVPPKPMNFGKQYGPRRNPKACRQSVQEGRGRPQANSQYPWARQPYTQPSTSNRHSPYSHVIEMDELSQTKREKNQLEREKNRIKRENNQLEDKNKLLENEKNSIKQEKDRLAEEKKEAEEKLKKKENEKREVEEKANADKLDLHEKNRELEKKLEAKKKEENQTCYEFWTAPVSREHCFMPRWCAFLLFTLLSLVGTVFGLAADSLELFN